VWILFMNDMRFAHSEDLAPVARAETKEELVAFVESQKVAAYKGTGPNAYEDNYTYNKCFKQGGPLEWYNEPMSEEESFREFSLEKWKEDALRQTELAWQEKVLSIPTVSTGGGA